MIQFHSRAAEGLYIEEIVAQKYPDVKVRIFTGSSPLEPDIRPTDNVYSIKTILSPLTRREVGTIRCIGLNYKEHAAEMGEAGATATVTDGDGKRTSHDSAADARPSQQHEWNGLGGSQRGGRRRSRKISGDVYGAPPFMATPEERDVDPLDDAGSGVGSSRDNVRGKQKSVSTTAYQVGP